MNLKEFLSLKEEVAELQSQQDRSAGRIQQLKKQLYDLSQCHTVGQARKLLRGLQQELKDDERRFETALQKFKEKYDEHPE